MKTFLNTVNGEGVASERTFESRNPATGATLGLVPESSNQQVAQAVAAAKAAQPAWAALSDAERKAYLIQAAQVIQDNAETLAEWVTREQGKPLGGLGPNEVRGAHFEVMACVAWTQVTANLDLPMEIVFEDEARRDELHRKPFGVIAAIAPWNWPLMIAIWQIIAPMRAGNTVVLKPSEYTSLGTLEMIRLIAGVLPPGVINTVSGAGEVGSALVENADVDKIMFTGSRATGIRITAAAARNLTPTTMELGGNDAAIVLADADPKAIAANLFWGAFSNMGQTCACAKRIYVHDTLHDALVGEFKTIANSLQMGDGMQPGIAIGPIQNRMQYDKVSALVEEARADGATIVTGGNPAPGPGFFYPVTLVTDIEDGASLVDQEQFGPALPIVRYTDLDAVIANANRLDDGLGASVWSSDIDKAKAVAGRIQAGTVWINQHGAVHPMVPFGGIKGSGWGVEFGIDGLKAVTVPQVISIKKG